MPFLADLSLCCCCLFVCLFVYQMLMILLIVWQTSSQLGTSRVWRNRGQRSLKSKSNQTQKRSFFCVKESTHSRTLFISSELSWSKEKKMKKERLSHSLSWTFSCTFWPFSGKLFLLLFLQGEKISITGFVCMFDWLFVCLFVRVQTAGEHFDWCSLRVGWDVLENNVLALSGKGVGYVKE